MRSALLACAAWAAFTPIAAAQSYEVPQFVVSAGAGRLIGGAYTLTGTVGEPASGGPVAGGQYAVIGGFAAFGGACPAITLSAATLPAATVGAAFPAVTLTQSGGAVIASFALTAGALPAGITMTIAGVIGGAPSQAGEFTFTVTATDVNGCSGSRSYTLSVSLPAPPTLSLDRTLLSFGAASNGAAFTAQTTAQIVRLTQSGAGAVTWTAASSVPWLSVTPASGSGSSALAVTVQFAAGLSASQAGAITFTITGAANTAGPINVSLAVSPADAVVAPFGSFDTPIDGTVGIAGSIAVTGWAMDDIEVTRVRILRDPVSPEPSGPPIFIGDAVLVDGARPDIAAAYPSHPRRTRGGWGYLMLTNFLPAQGNGTYKLYAYADDGDGHSTLLGVKTITCANAASTAPFGAIDTPLQGETVSGTLVNFGWTLIKGPTARADVPGGAQVTVIVDGVALGTPAGWSPRSDISGLFPSGFNDTGSAVAALGIDTTTLADGVHAIAWIVTASNGEAAGIGSRYFTVSNGSTVTGGVLPAPRSSLARAANGTDARGLQGRLGYDLDSPLQLFRPDEAGMITIDSEELDRIELHLPPGGGSIVTAEGPQPLPAGSRIDPQTGTFTWLAGPGFVGSYDLQFAGLRVRIVLHPKGSRVPGR